MKTDDASFCRLDPWGDTMNKVNKYLDSDEHKLSFADRSVAHTIMFVGAPYAYEAKWSYDKKKWVRFKGSLKDSEAALRIRINVFNVTKKRMQWFEMDTETFQQIYRLKNNYDFDIAVFLIWCEDLNCANAEYTFQFLRYTTTKQALAVSRHKQIDLSLVNS